MSKSDWREIWRVNGTVLLLISLLDFFSYSSYEHTHFYRCFINVFMIFKFSYQQISTNVPRLLLAVSRSVQTPPDLTAVHVWWDTPSKATIKRVKRQVFKKLPFKTSHLKISEWTGEKRIHKHLKTHSKNKNYCQQYINIILI